MSDFFFSSRRRHTRSLCDWSSDVCSSDLGRATDRTTSEILVIFDADYTPSRSEERRVGKECRSRWSAYPQKEKRMGMGKLFTTSSPIFFPIAEHISDDDRYGTSS